MKTVNFLKTMILALGLTQAALAAEPMTGETRMANESTWQVAPVVGLTSFNFSGSGLSSRGGFLIGGNVLMATPVEGLKVETGLNYLEAGAKTNTIVGSLEVALGYLALPVLVNYQLNNPEKGETAWYLRGGAMFTHLMSAKAKGDGWFAGEKDITDDLKKDDIMAIAGFGARWDVGNNYVWSVDASYVQGTADLGTVGTDKYGKSSGFIVGTALSIPL